MTRDPPQSDRTAVLAAGCLLVVMTVAAYGPALRAGFIWDDDAYVTANVTLRSLDGLRRIWVEPGVVPQYYPLTFTTLWIEYHLWGERPFGYHLVNVVLHAANAVLLWLILRRLHVPGAWLAAAVFALHPMEVESVAWITERKNVLSGMFALSAVLVYLRATPLAGSSGSMRWPRYLAVCVLFLAALLSKSVTCTLPAVLLLLAWWEQGRLERQTLWRVAPLAGLGIAMAVMTVWMERYHVGAEGQEWTLSVLERCLVAGRVLWFYPRTLLWPHPLTFIYPRWQIDAHLWWQYAFPLAAVVAFAGLFAGRRRCGRGPLTAALCYAGTLVPALGFFNVYPMRYSFVADHFAYLPSVALIVVASAGAARLLARTSRVVQWGCAAPVLLLLAALTVRQCGIYYDLRSLWTDTLAKNPDCWMAHNNFGMVRAADGNNDEAVAHYLEALRLKPDFSQAHNDLAVVLASQGKATDAIEHLHAAIAAQPDYAQAYSNLGNILQSQGRLADAVVQYAAALRWQPDYADAHFNLATLLAAQGQTDAATMHFEAALRWKPDYPQAHNNFGNLLREHGQVSAAVVHYREALRLQPSFGEAHNNLGVALAMQGNTAEALAQFALAVRAKPDYAEAYSNAGNVLQSQGRLADAVAQYMEALRLQPMNADAHNNLGMALLAQGKTADAIAHFEDAVRAKPESTQARANLDSAKARQRSANQE